MSVIHESHSLGLLQTSRIIKGLLFIRDLISNVSRKATCSSFLREQSALQTLSPWLLEVHIHSVT